MRHQRAVIDTKGAGSRPSLADPTGYMDITP
jgi:hypothetical protein